MSTLDHTAEEVSSLEYVLGAGFGAGLLGGLGMGSILHGGADMMTFIGALYGAPTVPAGWVAHLTNSVVIGIVFALIVSRSRIRERLSTRADFAIAGMLYATAIGLTTVGIMLPLSIRLLGRTGLPDPPLMFSGILGQLLVVISVAVAHLVYGLVLGVGYRFLTPPTGAR